MASGYRATNGADIGSGYVDVVTGFSQKSLLQFGVFVRNVNAGSAYELCNATIQIEPKRTP